MLDLTSASASIAGISASMLIAADAAIRQPPGRPWSTFALTWYIGMLAFYACVMTLMLTLYAFRPRIVETVMQGLLFPFAPDRIPVHVWALLVPAVLSLVVYAANRSSRWWRRRRFAADVPPAVMQAVFMALFVLGMVAKVTVQTTEP